MTAKLGLTSLANGASNQLIANENFEVLSQMVHPSVVDKDLSTPPGSPANGALYIVGASATGAWAGKEKHLAWWLSSISAWTFLAPAAGMSVRVLDELDGAGVPKSYCYTGTVWGIQTFGTATQTIAVACGDESTAITAGTAKVTFRIPFAFSLSEVRASLTVAQPSGSILTVDVHSNGTTIFSTKLTFDNTEKTTKTAATQPVVSTTSLPDDAEITIDVDQVGGAGAAGLKVYLVGVPS